MTGTWPEVTRTSECSSRAQGVDARTIMETLGHSTITMTLDTYTHVMQTTLKAAADRMDDALGPPAEVIPAAGRARRDATVRGRLPGSRYLAAVPHAIQTG